MRLKLSVLDFNFEIKKNFTPIGCRKQRDKKPSKGHLKNQIRELLKALFQKIFCKIYFC